MSTLFLSSNTASSISLKEIYIDTKKKEKLTSYEMAVTAYRKARYQLLNVGYWNRLKDLANWNYMLFDSFGNPKEGLCCEGDYIQFNLFGDNGNITGVGWMAIDKVLEVTHGDWGSTAIRLKPSSGPKDNQCISNTNHESMTLLIERNGNKVRACVHERNEVLQTREIKGIYNQLYNRIMDLLGHRGQWESLVNVLI